MAGAVVTAGAQGATTAALTRDEAARILWNLHYAPLAGWCAALVGDRDAAHDIASEAFARLLSRWLTVHDPKGYLYVTATNLVRDRWRREQRDRKLCERIEERTETSTPAGRPLAARPGRAAPGADAGSGPAALLRRPEHRRGRVARFTARKARSSACCSTPATACAE